MVHRVVHAGGKGFAAAKAVVKLSDLFDELWQGDISRHCRRSSQVALARILGSGLAGASGSVALAGGTTGTAVGPLEAMAELLQVGACVDTGWPVSVYRGIGLLA